MKKTKYIKMGDITVDSGKVMIADPCYIKDKKLTEIDFGENTFFKRIPIFDENNDSENDVPCKAILFGTRGDGLYEVFGKIEYDKELGEILTEIKIKIV